MKPRGVSGYQLQGLYHYTSDWGNTMIPVTGVYQNINDRGISLYQLQDVQN